MPSSREVHLQLDRDAVVPYPSPFSFAISTEERPQETELPVILTIGAPPREERPMGCMGISALLSRSKPLQCRRRSARVGMFAN
jgi:hypothetical protein